jgi:hypothetical protein
MVLVSDYSFRVIHHSGAAVQFEISLSCIAPRSYTLYAHVNSFVIHRGPLLDYGGYRLPTDGSISKVDYERMAEALHRDYVIMTEELNRLEKLKIEMDEKKDS